MPNMADMSAMMTNMMGAMSAGTMGQTVTSLAFSPDGRTLATGGVESKSNFDMAAMMSGAMNPGKRSKKQPASRSPGNHEEYESRDHRSGATLGCCHRQSDRRLKGHGKGLLKLLLVATADCWLRAALTTRSGSGTSRTNASCAL